MREQAKYPKTLVRTATIGKNTGASAAAAKQHPIKPIRTIAKSVIFTMFVAKLGLLIHSCSTPPDLSSKGEDSKLTGPTTLKPIIKFDIIIIKIIEKCHY